ncbi:MAG: phosphatidylserine decarboxylase family protein [Candidatus Magnetomorum sp.]|nr:phosphatidylserine decarboxylase family protein [Candidatus Magnetomorum sp.]
MNKPFDWADEPATWAFPVARPGLPFIYTSAFLALIFAILGMPGLTVFMLFTSLCITLFFRDPDRVIPQHEKAVISPADGKVIIAEIMDSSPYFDQPCLKISIFMTVFNVHVNRMPCNGKVADVIYHPGKFVSANLDKASTDNERNAVVVNLENGQSMAVVQIAGLIARRIISQVHPGDTVQKGQRFGMICFGSRLDVYLPQDTELHVKVGDRVKSGASILAYLV